jgi:hypothetical protein
MVQIPFFVTGDVRNGHATRFADHLPIDFESRNEPTMMYASSREGSLLQSGETQKAIKPVHAADGQRLPTRTETSIGLGQGIVVK